VTDEVVFAAALALDDPSERAAYLDRACAGNPELLTEVESLLAAHAAESPLDRPPPDVPGPAADGPVPDTSAARPPGIRSRVRARATVWCVALLVVVALTGLGVRSDLAVRAELAHQREELRRVEASAAVNREVLLFVRREVLEPGAGRPNALEIRQALDAAAARLDDRFPDRPLVEAGARFCLGLTYQALGDEARTRSQLERACTLYQAAPTHAPDDGLRADYYRACAALAPVWVREGAGVRATSALREGAEWFERTRGAHDPDALDQAHGLARLLMESPYPDAVAEAKALARSILDRTAGRTDPEQWAVKRTLGYALVRGGNAAEGEALLRAVVASCVAHGGENALETARSRFVLSRALVCSGPSMSSGNLVEGLALAERCTPVFRSELSDGCRPTQEALVWLAGLRERSGRPADAAEAFLIALRSAAFVADTGAWFRVRATAVHLLRDGFADRAERLLLAFRGKSAAAADPWWDHEVTSLLGDALLAQNRVAEGERLLADGYDGLRRRVETIDVEFRLDVLVSALDRLIRAAESHNRPADARRWRAEKVRLMEVFVARAE
jgi:hypothetical protein